MYDTRLQSITKILCTAVCLVVVSAAQAQFTIDDDTSDLSRGYGQTWWFDDDDSGNSIIVSNINASATPDGPLPGWAWTRLNFMVASNLVVSEAGAADVVTNITAAGPGDILEPGPVEVTITNDLNIGSLTTEEDVFIGEGATLTLDGGGLMLRGSSDNIRTPIGSLDGFITSSYTEGNGTNELFLVVTDDATAYQFFGIEIVDGGPDQLTLIVDGYVALSDGEVRLSEDNHHSGGYHRQSRSVLGCRCRLLRLGAGHRSGQQCPGVSRYEYRRLYK